ncbi:nascent polypeptide-associated complex subunit alpha, muscle-specific form-like [Cervus canadensis]|uniref:nascent polypeptide-associated complex subunit alpha, muscle-specific form-like n=1 Tax=Cervus canadensis TaxID=1574408 RepID=UPI001C9E98D9|nr:nascent polypeptide-associated complex subunit alpha, muscle-specific form-like [Cervus canadensis]
MWVGGEASPPAIAGSPVHRGRPHAPGAAREGHPNQAKASPGQSRRQGTRSALGQGRASAGRAWTRPRFGSRAEQAPGGRLRGSGRAGRAGASEPPRREERRGGVEAVRERASPSPPPPAPRSSPAPGIRAAVAVQAADSSSPSLGRLSARSERAAPRSSAHRSRPVSPGPSRGQPCGVASRPTRPAAEEREEDGTPAPPPPIRER